MNERIQELARQAFINAGYDTEDELFDILFKQGTEFHEKFAELIVRECIKESLEEIVADEDIPEINDPCAREYLKGNNQGIVDAVVRFRNHFGVEE